MEDFFCFLFFQTQSLILFQILFLQEVDERSKSFVDLSGNKNQDLIAQQNQREISGLKAKKSFQWNTPIKDSIPLSSIDMGSERAVLFQAPDKTALLGQQRMPRQKGTTQRRSLENWKSKVNSGTPGHFSSATQQRPMQFPRSVRTDAGSSTPSRALPVGQGRFRRPGITPTSGLQSPGFDLPGQKMI